MALRYRKGLRLPTVLVAAFGSVALAATACSSSGASSSPPSQANAASTVMVQTHSGPLGTYLTDQHGMSLYMFASDKGSKSSCVGQCLTYWPPLIGNATAASGAKMSMLATVTDANGTQQVTYAGHLLYTYVGDKSPGDTKGQGINNFGAKWWLMAPSGQPITGAGSSGSSSSSGGGGW